MGYEAEPEPSTWQSPFARTMHGQAQPAVPYVAPSNTLAGPNSHTGMSAETTSRVDRLQALLSKKLGPEYLSTRPGGGSTTLTYIEGWRVINLANEVFGYNGWYTEIRQIEVDFVDFDPETRRYCMGVSAIVRVRLQDGASHEDIGYGKLENSKSKADGLDKCKKEAVTDALKRTLRNFGSLLGNCLYDKQYTAAVGNVKSKKQKLDFNEIHRPDWAVAAKSASTSAAPAPDSAVTPPTTAKPSPHRPPLPPPQQNKPRVQPPRPQRAATTGSALQNRAPPAPQNRPAPAPVRQPVVQHQQQQQQQQPEPLFRSETADPFGGEDDAVFQDVNLNAATYDQGQGDESMQGLAFEGDSGFSEGGIEYESVKADPAPPPARVTAPAPARAPSVRSPEEQERAKQQAQERRRQAQLAAARQAATAQQKQAPQKPVATSAASMLPNAPKPGLRPARPPPSRATSVPLQHPNGHQTPHAAASRPIPRPAVQAGQVPQLNVGGLAGRVGGGGGGGGVSEVIESVGVHAVAGQAAFQSARALKRPAESYEPTPSTQSGAQAPVGTQHRSPLRELEGGKRFKEG